MDVVVPVLRARCQHELHGDGEGPVRVCAIQRNLLVYHDARSGNGGCATAFTGLEKLGVSQLVTGADASGAPVLQATRQGLAMGPGSITSSGGCREPAQGGSTCAAPGWS